MAEERRRVSQRPQRRLANPADLFADDRVDPLMIALEAQVNQEDPKTFARAPLAGPATPSVARAPGTPEPLRVAPEPVRAPAPPAVSNAAPAAPAADPVPRRSDPPPAPAPAPAPRRSRPPVRSQSVRLRLHSDDDPRSPRPEVPLTAEEQQWFEPIVDIEPFVPEAKAAPAEARPAEAPAAAEPAAAVEPVTPPAPAVVAPVAEEAPPRVITWSEQVAAEAIAREAQEALEAQEELNTRQDLTPAEPAEPRAPKRVRSLPRLVPEPAGAEQIALASMEEDSEDSEARRIEANRARLLDLAGKISSEAPEENGASLQAGIATASEPHVEDPAEEAARIAANRERLQALAERLAQAGDLSATETPVDFAVPTKRVSKSRAARDDDASRVDDAAS